MQIEITMSCKAVQAFPWSIVFFYQEPITAPVFTHFALYLY